MEIKAPIKDEGLLLVKKQISFILPKKFIELLKISDGGDIHYVFDYYDIDSKDIIGSVISVIYGTQNGNYNLIKGYYEPAEFFPKNLVTFGELGNGDTICFDYSADPKTDNPPVVYWNVESTEEKDISPLVDDFMGFLRMLREPEPIGNYLKNNLLE